MNSEAWGEAYAAPDLALAIFHAPARFAELLHGKGRLPGETERILQQAAEAVRAGSYEAISESDRAALFFVEHVLLARGADHYRVLGLERGAAEDTIRDRYRLLMRIFHPDRCGWLDIDSEALAARINLAHQTLRDERSRSAYDLSLRQAAVARPATAARPPSTAQQRRRRSSASDEPLLSHLPNVVQRNLPQFVLGSVAMFGVLLIAGAWLSRAPSGAMGSGKSLQASELAELGWKDGEAARPAAAPPATQPSPTEAASPRPRTENRTTPPAAAATSPTAPTSVPMERGTPATSRPGGEAPPLDHPATPAPVAAAPAHATPPVTAHPAPEAVEALTLVEVDQLLARFTEAYRSGDIERFMDLFAAEARSGSGGRADIRQHYVELFRSTRQRALELPRMEWMIAGDTARGDGKFKLRLDRGGIERHFGGSLRLEVVRSGGRPMIVDIAHHEIPLEAPPTVARSEAPAAAVARPAPPAAPAAEPTPAPPAAVGLTQEDGAALLDQLVQRYRNGQLDDFMELFASDAHSSSGDREAIRKDYEELFASTTNRRLQLRKLDWSLAGDSGQASGEFLIRLHRAGDSAERIYTGTLNLQFARKGSRVQIKRLTHETR